MPLSWNEIKSKALAFSKQWADASSEDSEAKPFWIDFFDIFGITNKRIATFEHAVKKLPGAKAKTDGFVDLFWPGMLLVEHKSRGKDLDKAMDQAMGYMAGIAERELPQIIIVCDFARFRVRQLATGEEAEFLLADLHKNIKLFGLVAGYKPQHIAPQDPVNIKAAERMGTLHDALKASGYEGHALEVLLVRLLFCLFADDTGIFQPAQAFRAFIEERTGEDGSDLGPRLAQLFQVLNTPEDKRSKTLDEQLNAFPYVNGKLFEEPLPLADFDRGMREALLNASALDWSAISPAIFGSLFQSIMDEKARRNLGAHYTSEENILKLIKPLFLDELWAEFHKVKTNKNKLFEFHKKLRTLTFFDPACGCGNFLVISYREMRLLELEVLRASHTTGQQALDVHQLISLNVDQFYGIEIEEFPAQIAQVALWLLDHQMNLQVSEEFGMYFARIPLRHSARVVHGNALRLDWNEVLPVERCSYVLGNPPFKGHQLRSPEQQADMDLVWGVDGSYGRLDFVTCWLRKALDYMHLNKEIFCAFVSTNSICQGEQVGTLWGYLLGNGAQIHFAHRTFSWSNEAKGNAAVHCVIVGFGVKERLEKIIFEYEDIKGKPLATPANNINPYLVDGPNVILPARTKTPTNLPQLIKGSQPTDGGHLLLTNAEKDELLLIEPCAEKWLRMYVGGDELINGNHRWCLWLKGIQPAELKALPQVMKRLSSVANARRKSPTKSVRDFADHPTLFTQDRQPDSDYLALSRHSSENRRYIPIGFLPASIIASDAMLVCKGAGIYHFGIMNSAMHNSWIRYTCGRIKSDFRYEPSVYNNFPWPKLETNSEVGSVEHKAKAAIETTAQAVLDARAEFQQGDKPSSLADLYDPISMPPALVKAHQKLDAAVDAAYALTANGKKTYKNDAERVAYLFELYQAYTSLLPAEKPKAKRKTSKLT